MKRLLSVLLGCCLAATWVGCQSATDGQSASDGPAPAAEAGAGTAGSSEFTLVTLKVPNMTWGGCAASVRGDLAKIDGVEGIETDVNAKTCSFKVTKPDVDYKAKLEEFAQTNSHLAGYTIQ